MKWLYIAIAVKWLYIASSEVAIYIASSEVDIAIAIYACYILYLFLLYIVAVKNGM